MNVLFEVINNTKMISQRCALYCSLNLFIMGVPLMPNIYMLVSEYEVIISINTYIYLRMPDLCYVIYKYNNQLCM